MKSINLFLITLFTLGLTNLYGQNATADIKVVVHNIESNEGSIMIGLYNSANTFLKEGGYKYLTIPAKKGSIETTFKDVPYGEYAISLFHDKDDNKELNLRFGLIPSEPYSVSNNAKEKYSAPKWNKAVFKVLNQNITQNINL